MSNISGKINLAALIHSRMTTKKGADCIVIPIKENNLFASDKGNVYLDLQANEHIDADKKTTHIVNQGVPKEVYEKLKAAGEYAPTLGNLTEWSKLGGGEPAPNQSQEFTPEPGEDDSLPF